MSVQATIAPFRLDVVEFRAFEATRPDEERWELIDGMPVMNAAPLPDHAVIAGNLHVLLANALATHDRSRRVVQAPGVALGIDALTVPGLGKGSRYAPEPDVAVIARHRPKGRRLIETAFVLAEVASSTDEEPVLSGGIRWIDAKARLYRAHPHCEAVLVIEQDRVEARLWLRRGEDWTERRLTSADDLVIPSCGLACRVLDLYAGTELGEDD